MGTFYFVALFFLCFEDNTIAQSTILLCLNEVSNELGAAVYQINVFLNI